MENTVVPNELTTDEEPCPITQCCTRFTRPEKSAIVYFLSAILIVMFWTALAILFVAQNNAEDHLDSLKTEVQLLKSELELLQSLLDTQTRHKRESERNGEGDTHTAEASGVHVYDFSYGVDLNQKSELSVYPSLMGDLNRHNEDDRPSSITRNTGDSANARDVSNQLGIHRQHHQSQNQVHKPNKSVHQSSYAKRVNSHRRSRVSSTHDTPPPPVIVRDPVEQQNFAAAIEREHKKPMLKSLDSSRMFDSVASPLLSIHFQAKVSLDESSADLTSGLHKSWRPSKWSRNLHGASLFSFNEETGQVEVPEDGLYLIYAQIEYLDAHIINGFEINVDNEATLSCVVSSHGLKDKKKHNTCHTSGVIYLQRGSMINVRDKEAGRYSLLHSKGTFLGITKISTA